ncbi:MAG: lasso peptide biosynthesis B2 protein [Caldilineaceae bacterium]
MKKITKLWRLTWSQRGLVVEAFCLLGLTRAVSFWLPFRYLIPYLGAVQQESPVTVEPSEKHLIAQIGWIVSGASQYTPWTSNCMAQAMTAKLMLRRRGIPSTLYIGVAKTDELLAGHAWLRAGTSIVTGGGTLGRYKQVIHFGT